MVSIQQPAAAFGLAGAEVSSAAWELSAAALRQLARGLCLGVVGICVILSVGAVLVGFQELGAGGAPQLPPGLVRSR